MAIAIRTGEETRQVQMVCLDELVGEDDVLRRVERLVDWELVRETARPFYSDFGRPGVDPVVLVKVFLVAAIRGSDSMRETLRVARVDLSIRRFLGYGLTEALPHHATFSYAQCVRFANASVFEQLFTQVLASCREAGLLDRSRLIVDATHGKRTLRSRACERSFPWSIPLARTTGTRRSTRTRRGIGNARSLSWPRHAVGRHRNARRPTRPRCRGPIRTRSCATSPGIGRIWCTARRSRPTRKPG